MNQRSLTAQILGSVENARHYLGQSMQVNEANGITVDKGRKTGAETLFLVRRNGTPIGFVTKITNTRTTTHPYKATVYDGGYNPETANDHTDYKSTFLGFTYTPGKAGMQKAVNAVATRTPLKGDPATNEARKTKTYKRGDCSVTTWFERDRAHVAIECGNDTVAEWWDDEVQDMTDSGYFTMGKGKNALERSVLDYAVEMGLISEGVNEATENPELTAAMDTLVRKATDLVPGGWVSGGVVLSLGVPVGKLKVHAKPKGEWSNGIFENGPSISVLIQNDNERPVGMVSVTGGGPASGGSNGRGATYSVSFTNFARGYGAPSGGQFKPRDKNKAPLAKIVEHVLRTLQSFKSAITPAAESVSESRLYNNKAVFDAYVEAALWSSTAEDGSPLDDDFGPDDIAPSTLKAMKRDVDDFIKYVQAQKIDTSDWTADQFGHDFWLSRNGHGAGFFDRSGASARKLQAAAKTYGGFDLYVGDDNKVYAMGESINESVKTQAGAQRTVQSHGIDIGTYRRLLKSLGDATPGSMLVLSVTEPNSEYANRTGLGTSAEIKIVQAGDSTELRGHDIKRTVGSTSSRSWSGNSQTVTVLAVNESVNEGRVTTKVCSAISVDFIPGVTACLYPDGTVVLCRRKDYDNKGTINGPVVELGKGDALFDAVAYDWNEGFDMTKTEHAAIRAKASRLARQLPKNESVNEARGWDYDRRGPGLLITAPDGRTCWLQGDEASELEDQLDAAKNQAQIDRILDAYDSVCEARTPRSGSVQLAQYIADWMDSDRPTATDLGNTYHFDVKTAKDIYAWHAATLKSGSGRDEFVQKLAAILQKVSDRNFIKAAYSESGPVDVDAILEAKRKAKGIYRTGDNGVFFIANKDIDKSKVAKTDAKMAKKYGKDFAGLSPKDKLRRIKGVKSRNESIAETDDNYMPDGGTEESRSYYFLMHRAKKDGMNTEKPTVFNFVLDVSKRLDYDIDAGLALARYVLQLAMGDTPLPAPVVAVVGRGPIPPAVRKITALPRWAVAVGTLTLSKAAAFAVLILEDMNARAECRALADALAIVVRRSGNESVVEGLGKVKNGRNQPITPMKGSWADTQRNRSPDEITLTHDRNGEYLVNITGGWAKGKGLDTVELGADITSARERARLTDELSRWYGLGDRGVFVRDDGTKAPSGFPTGTGSFVKAAKALGIKVKVQESSDMNIAQRALIEARKKMGVGSDVSKEVSEISTGARTMGFLLSDAPQSEKDKIAPGGKSFVSPSNTIAKIESFLGSVEEAQQKLTKAELILMDRKRKKREKRGKGLNATGKQRLAAKRNVKKAQRAMLKGSTQRKLAKTKARRAKLRGKD